MRLMSLYIGLAFFVVLILILAIPFRIILDYRLKQGEDLLSVEVFWLGFRLVHGFIPVFWTAESEPEAGLGENEGGANYTIDVQARETPSVPGDIGAIINALARCYHFIFDAAHVILRGDYPPSNRHSPLYR
ncbi:MAG: hypothetical protein GX855_10605, partial [Firmicutes bacterium]|nr:hypothetical protein [Bacillota bacterium]